MLIGDDGIGFVKSANDLEALPYLPVIEILLLALPFGIHAFWGIKYLFTGEFNSFRTDMTKPSLSEYPRNKAYTWQRITSWILLVLVTAHVVQMRFMESPIEVQKGADKLFLVRVKDDPGLHSLSARLGADIYDSKIVSQELQDSSALPSSKGRSPQALILEQQQIQQEKWTQALKKLPLRHGQVLIVAKNFGVADLLMVRDTFKDPLMLVLYTVLVLSACFHGYNGLWTFMIKWGVTLSVASQNWMRKLAYSFMFLVTFMGLAAIWGTYWINLRY